MSSDYIPFNRPCFEGKELAYITEAVGSGKISGDGAFTRKCESFLAEKLGVLKALLTTSCTDALEMAAILARIELGDEVIVPSFTFVSTINAFVLRGCTPVFIDSRPDTLNMDEAQLDALITPRTKAIVPVHYAGVGCEMDMILPLAARHGIPVIEDNAGGLLGKYRGRYLGSLGHMATQSFHETKNFTCGEGGALLINDPALIERAEIIREKGTNRSQFFRGQVDKYSWVDVGSSFLPSDVVAAFLYAQLEFHERIQAKRRQVWDAYQTGLADWALEQGVRLPIIPSHCEQSYHMFYMLMPSLDARQRLIAHLGARNILAVFHYLPLHLSTMGQRYGGRVGQCPVAEDVSDRLIRLPFYNDLPIEDQCRVIDAVQDFRT